MKKKITAAILFCTILMSTSVAMARLNWYDRVLQPIVTNQLAPAWNRLITNPLLAIYTVVFQIGQRISPENLSPLFNIPILNPKTTQAEEHEKERIAYNEMFKSELSKVTTIEAESPGIFAHVNQTIKNNADDWEQKNKEKKTALNFDKKIENEVLNRDGYGDVKSNVPLALKVTLNSTPQATKLLDPEIRKETTDYLTNYQMMVYNEKIKENEESLKRISKLMAELEKVMSASNNVVGTAQQEAERKAMVAALTTAIKDEQMKMKMSTERVQQVENMVNEQKEIAEQKVGIASMHYYGFDPYNPDVEDQKRGILPVEKLDKGYVTRNGLRKP